MESNPKGDFDGGLKPQPPSVFDAFKEFGDAGKSVSNIVGNGQQQLKLLALVTSGGSIAGGDNVGKEIAFKWWFVQAVDIESEESGEIKTTPRTVLVTADYTAYTFASHGVYQSLRTILQFYGTGDLDKPVKVRISQKNTRKGQRVLFLEPIIDE